MSAAKKTPGVKAPKPPRFVWFDYDCHAPKGSKWIPYQSKADQRASRPDLLPMKFRVVPLKGGAR